MVFLESKSNESLDQYLSSTTASEPVPGDSESSSVKGNIHRQSGESATQLVSTGASYSSGQWGAATGSSMSQLSMWEDSSTSMGGKYSVSTGGVTSTGRLDISDSSYFMADMTIYESLDSQGAWQTTGGSSENVSRASSSIIQSTGDSIYERIAGDGTVSGYRGSSVNSWDTYEYSTIDMLQSDGTWQTASGTSTVSYGAEFGTSYNSFRRSRTEVAPGNDPDDTPRIYTIAISESGFSGSGLGNRVSLAWINGDWEETDDESPLLTETVRTSYSCREQIPSYTSTGRKTTLTRVNSNSYNYHSAIEFNSTGTAITSADAKETGTTRRTTPI